MVLLNGLHFIYPRFKVFGNVHLYVHLHRVFPQSFNSQWLLHNTTCVNVINLCRQLTADGDHFTNQHSTTGLNRADIVRLL